MAKPNGVANQKLYYFQIDDILKMKKILIKKCTQWLMYSGVNFVLKPQEWQFLLIKDENCSQLTENLCLKRLMPKTSYSIQIPKIGFLHRVISIISVVQRETTLTISDSTVETVSMESETSESGFLKRNGNSRDNTI